MAKEYAAKFYISKAWRMCRASYISKVHGICEHCGRSGYIVDHVVEITPENITDANITLNHDNLQYLCLDCHNKKTFTVYGVTREDVRFDKDGELIRTKTYSPP